MAPRAMIFSGRRKSGGDLAAQGRAKHRRVDRFLHAIQSTSVWVWVAAPRPQRLGGRFQRVSFVFLVGAGEAVLGSDETDSEGISPLACSRPSSRRGQAKSSARPAGGVSGSPLNSVRAASGS